MQRNLNAVAVDGQENELNDVLHEVVDIVKSIRKSTKQRLFSKLYNEIDTISKKLILHSKVRWLSQGKVLFHVFELREQLKAYCTEQENQNAAKFHHKGKGGDIFKITSKIKALKQKNSILEKQRLRGIP